MYYLDLKIVFKTIDSAVFITQYEDKKRVDELTFKHPTISIFKKKTEDYIFFIFYFLI